jgi:hypothetical protein
MREPRSGRHTENKWFLEKAWGYCWSRRTALAIRPDLLGRGVFRSRRWCSGPAKRNPHVHKLDIWAGAVGELPESRRDYGARRAATSPTTAACHRSWPPLTLNKHSTPQRFCPILDEPINAKSHVFAGKTQRRVVERRGWARLSIRWLRVRFPSPSLSERLADCRKPFPFLEIRRRLSVFGESLLSQEPRPVRWFEAAHSDDGLQSRLSENGPRAPGGKSITRNGMHTPARSIRAGKPELDFP